MAFFRLSGLKLCCYCGSGWLQSKNFCSEVCLKVLLFAGFHLRPGEDHGTTLEEYLLSKSEAFAEDPAAEIQACLQEQRFWNKGCNLSVYYQENRGGLQSKNMFRQGWISTKESWSIWEGKSKSLSDFDHNVFQLLKHHSSVFYHTHIYKHFMMHFLNIKGCGAFWLEPWQYSRYDCNLSRPLLNTKRSFSCFTWDCI